MTDEVLWGQGADGDQAEVEVVLAACWPHLQPQDHHQEQSSMPLISHFSADSYHLREEHMEK